MTQIDINAHFDYPIQLKKGSGCKNMLYSFNFIITNGTCFIINFCRLFFRYNFTERIKCRVLYSSHCTGVFVVIRTMRVSFGSRLPPARIFIILINGFFRWKTRLQIRNEIYTNCKRLKACIWQKNHKHFIACPSYVIV